MTWATCSCATGPALLQCTPEFIPFSPSPCCRRPQGTRPGPHISAPRSLLHSLQPAYTTLLPFPVPCPQVPTRGEAWAACSCATCAAPARCCMSWTPQRRTPRRITTRCARSCACTTRSTAPSRTWSRLTRWTWRWGCGHALGYVGVDYHFMFLSSPEGRGGEGKRG